MVVVVGENPYAEMMGDSDDLNLSDEHRGLVKRCKDLGKQVIVILISGRALTIKEELSKSDAFIAAWLPGSEGQGIADVLFGDYDFSGKLSFSWPTTSSAPLFPLGYGLSCQQPG